MATSLSSPLSKHIDDFLEYLEIEKNASKLTIRNYRDYLEEFEKWYSSTPSTGHSTLRAEPLGSDSKSSGPSGLPKSIENLDLRTVRRYRVHLANKVDQKGKTIKKGDAELLCDRTSVIFEVSYKE